DLVAHCFASSSAKARRTATLSLLLDSLLCLNTKQLVCQKLCNALVKATSSTREAVP
ncbi:MAG: hypothetical protein ACI8W7_000775, partial [Gammaproteobacteria bacterium]